MGIEKRPDETPLEFQKRIINGKLEDKTLADYDYSELAEMVYGKAYAPDVARRMFYGAKRVFDLLDENMLSDADGDVTKEIDDKIKELQKERQRFFDQRREYKKLLTTEARWEYLVDTICDSIKDLGDSVGELDLASEVEWEMDDNEAVLILNDWHYGLVADNMYNSYNKQICKDRVNKVVSKTIERLVLHKSRVLNVVLLGDFIHGACHVGVRVDSEESVCNEIMQVSEILAQAIAKMSKYVEKVFVYSTYGNHARVIQNKSESKHADNLERLIPWWLSQRFASSENNNIYITSESNNEILFIDVKGYGIAATHGDLDALKQSPLLLSQVFRKKYGRDMSCFIMGDKHHYESVENAGIRAMICGCLCGPDSYASERRLFSTPTQTLFFVTDDGIDAEYQLRCE